MANAFMPSAFASMAGAGQDTLEQIMKQRLFEQQLMQSQVGMQRQVNTDLEQSRRFDAQERYQQGLLADREQDNQVRLRIAQGKLDADTASTQQQQNVLAQIADLMKAGDYDGADDLRVRYGLPSNIVTRPKKEETPAERSARLIQDEIDRATGKAQGLERNPGLKPTRIAKGERPEKDKPGLPSGFRQAIRNRIGSTGFEDRDAAFKSLQQNWTKWRANYPDLDASLVKSELENIYGPEETKGGVWVLNANDAAAAAQGRAAAAKGHQR
jgi:hypothetical protein